MIKELYVSKLREVAINVNISRIDSIRKKNITKSTCRVYKDGYIGVAGTLGEATQGTWERAEEKLKDKVQYDAEPCKNEKRKEDYREDNISINEFINKVENILNTLREDYPDFMFLDMIKLIETENIIKNDAGLDYVSIDRYFIIDLGAKYKDSAEIEDVQVSTRVRKFDTNLIIGEIKKQLDAYTNEVPLPNKDKMPVVVSFADIGYKLTEYFNGKSLMTGSSIFSDKLGKKIFSEDFTLYVDRSKDNFYVPFFDAEGSTLENDKIALIDKGVLKCGYTDKETSTMYKVQDTAAADSEYDEVPNLAIRGMFEHRLNVKPGNRTLSEILGDKEAIYVVAMQGGDYTNEGKFASPVQVSYLMKNGKLIGRLPEFSVSGSIYDILGKDYLGQSLDKAYMGTNVMVTNMSIN